MGWRSFWSPGGRLAGLRDVGEVMRFEAERDEDADARECLDASDALRE